VVAVVAAAVVTMPGAGDAVSTRPATARPASTRPATTARPATARPATARPATARPATARPATTRAGVAAATVTSATTAPARLSGPVTVFAAASLSAALTAIAAAFERANPAASVTLSFAGSSTLVTQIRNGAPADVFAAADVQNMSGLVEAGLVAGEPAIFTRNRPMIVVPKGNPLGVRRLSDLARPEVFVALGAPGVPVGDYARGILARAGVDVTPKSLESSVSAIVSKAALREIDAGIVYVTDVALDDSRVEGVAIPDEQNVVATYPIAALRGARSPAVAQGFVAFTRSSAAQAILARYRFLPLR
jgi:molybdate transport system substrate-binding protein